MKRINLLIILFVTINTFFLSAAEKQDAVDADAVRILNTFHPNASYDFQITEIK